MNLSPIEIKAFVPATDFGRARDFYRALGFDVRWDSGELAYICYGGTSFLLQRYDRPGFVEHYMMHLLVEDVDDWHTHVEASGVARDFGVDVGRPEVRPWGIRDFTLSDPSGVLWRIGQNLPR